MTNRGSIIFALGGVHGAVTLALVYMIIDSVSSSQFGIIILAEMLMIVLSMIVPTIAFRFLLPHNLSVKESIRQTNQLRDEMVEEGINAVKKIYLPENVRQSVLYDLQDQKNANSFSDFWRQWIQASWRT